jgi:hypothetical protein
VSAKAKRSSMLSRPKAVSKHAGLPTMVSVYSASEGGWCESILRYAPLLRSVATQDAFLRGKRSVRKSDQVQAGEPHPLRQAQNGPKPPPPSRGRTGGGGGMRVSPSPNPSHRGRGTVLAALPSREGNRGVGSPCVRRPCRGPYPPAGERPPPLLGRRPLPAPIP